MKIENFKITKTFINTREIRTGDLLRITKEDDNDLYFEKKATNNG